MSEAIGETMTLDMEARAARERSRLRVLNRFAVELISIPNAKELAWFVAREVVGKLGFVDCVVYYLNSAGDALQQIAAIGEKNPSDELIVNPLEIRLGKGITGSVAANRKPEIVDDLSQDKRYIADQTPALSEICVPVLDGDDVLGVIDCEDPQGGKFDHDDLEILGAVAALTSAKLVLLRTDASLRESEKIREAKEIAERANQAKSQFLSSMSHELRTPLNSILGFSQLLAMDTENPLNETQARFVGHVLNNGKHLLDLINQILDLSKIETGNESINIQALSVAAIIEDCVAVSHPIAVEHGIGLAVDAFPTIAAMCLADERQLRQVLLNLLSNAIKYNSEAGNVRLSVSRSGADAIRVSVHDTGRGMTPDQIEQAFEPFNRLEHETSEIQGSGIGLTIAKQLIESMNGRIGCESRVGAGTTFWIELPIAD